MFYADSMGFLGKRGGPIVVEKGLKLDLVCLTAVPPWINTMKETLVEIEKFKKMIQDQPRLRLVTNQENLSSAVADKKIAIVLGMQNTPSDILSIDEVSAIRKAGVRIICPCYDKQNDLGSGWLNTDVGLTEAGKSFIDNCAYNDIIVDLSHSGHRMARDIISFKEKFGFRFNIMTSHGGCYSQYHHFRNLPDDVLKGVVELGGMVGISTLTFANDEFDNSPDAFIRHLAYAIKLCGNKSVCIGSDDLYITRDVEESRKQFEIMSKKLDPLGTQGVRFPENPLETAGPNMLDRLYATINPKYPFAPVRFSYETCEGVFGKNLLNFFERALPFE